MSVLIPADHHATFAGWTTERRKGSEDSWSSRKRMGFFLASALASWILVLSPFLLID